MNKKEKIGTFIGSIFGVFLFWLLPNIVFFSNYGIVFGIEQSKSTEQDKCNVYKEYYKEELYLCKQNLHELQRVPLLTKTIFFFDDSSKSILDSKSLIACGNTTYPITTEQCCDLYMNNEIPRRTDLIHCETIRSIEEDF